MTLSTLDWSIIAGFLLISLLIGVIVSRQSGKSSADFFLSGRNMPWWLLGVSMVATTFSADTPNLVTDIIRKNGVAGNWIWWAFLITGMMTVFIYAKLWRRSGIMTDLEFYELRYSGKEAAFLRGFRALYLGVVFNVLIMATVCLAAIKIGSTLLGLEPMQTLLIASVVTVAYSAVGGLRGIILTDFFQFIVAMIGTIWAAIVIVNLPEVGGLDVLVSHENVVGKMDLIPDFNNTEALVSLLIIPLAVQWWAAYYPGAEPGGGGYIVQRMLSAKDEKNAVGATLLFNIAHYALRPWPWILIALASIIIFPMSVGYDTDKVVIHENAIPFLEKNVNSDDVKMLQESITYNIENAKPKTNVADLKRLNTVITENIEAPQIQSLAYIFKQKNSDKEKLKPIDKRSNPLEAEKKVNLQLAYPNVSINQLDQDLAYPAMLTYLPKGLLGIVIASLVAAFMSTISTHLNWGSSYIVNDFYKRFMNADASEKQQVLIGRISTVLLMILAAYIALQLQNAKAAFDIIVLMGAGTGLLFILRWFWWRINAYSEIAAMIISFGVAVVFKFILPEGTLAGHVELLLSVAITTIGWIIVTFMTPAVERKTLIDFYNLIKPHKGGWQPVIQEGISKQQIKAEEVTTGQLPKELTGMFAGIFLVYGILFTTGLFLYGHMTNALIGCVITVFAAAMLWRSWQKV